MLRRIPQPTAGLGITNYYGLSTGRWVGAIKIPHGQFALVSQAAKTVRFGWWLFFFSHSYRMDAQTATSQQLLGWLGV